MPFKIIRNDITKMKVDAVVNTANPEPIYSRGTDIGIYMAAGREELLKARQEIGVLEEGDAAVTPGFALPANYIIHAVSPRYYDGTRQEADKLRFCYEKSLHLAVQHKCQSIAFPLIATGSYGFPKAEGLEIALSVIHSFLMQEDMMIYLVLFDHESVRLSGHIFEDIEEYIDENYVREKKIEEYGNHCESSIGNIGELPLDEDEELIWDNACEEPAYWDAFSNAGECASMPIMSAPVPRSTVPERSLEDIIAHIGETFQQRLFRLIDEKGREDVEVYKRAGKDKKFFHKIRSNVHYQPSKHTVFAFALSLELSLDETKDLLASAGFAISPASRFDLIMQYLFEQKIYDIYKIDCILYEMGETHYFGCEQ